MHCAYCGNDLFSRGDSTTEFWPCTECGEQTTVLAPATEPILCYLQEDDPPEQHDLATYGCVCGQCYNALEDMRSELEQKLSSCDIDWKIEVDRVKQIIPLAVAAAVDELQDSFAGTFANINDTCRARGFQAGPSGTSTEDRVIAMAQAFDGAYAALNTIAKKYHVDRADSLPAQGYDELECAVIGAQDELACVARLALSAINDLQELHRNA